MVISTRRYETGGESGKEDGGRRGTGTVCLFPRRKMMGHVMFQLLRFTNTVQALWFSKHQQWPKE